MSDDGISSSDNIDYLMELQGLAKTVKYYSIKMSSQEAKLIYELIVNQIGYIKDDLNSYEECRRRPTIRLKESLHHEMDRLQNQLVVLYEMERDVKTVMENLQREEMEQDLK